MLETARQTQSCGGGGARAKVGLLLVSVTCKNFLERVKNNSRALGSVLVGWLVGWLDFPVLSLRPGPQQSIQGNQREEGRNLKNSVSGHGAGGGGGQKRHRKRTSGDVGGG